MKIVNYVKSDPGKAVRDIRVLRETLFSTALLHPNIVVVRATLYSSTMLLQSSHSYVSRAIDVSRHVTAVAGAGGVVITESSILTMALVAAADIQGHHHRQPGPARAAVPVNQRRPHLRAQLWRAQQQHKWLLRGRSAAGQ